MKILRPIILLFAAIILGACTTDNTNPETLSTVSAVIDGEFYTFNTVNVEQRHYEDYTDVEVIASINNDPARTVAFVVTQNHIGPTASWYFSYFLNETAYPKMDGFATQVTTNTTSRLIGTFSGEVKSIAVEPEIILTVTNGAFDIIY